MSVEEGAMSMPILKDHEVHEFEMFRSKLERYFKDFQKHSNVNEVIIPDYPPISLERLPRPQQPPTSSKIANDHKESYQNSPNSYAGKVLERNKEKDHSRISLQGVKNRREISPPRSLGNAVTPSGNATLMSSFNQSKRFPEQLALQNNELVNAHSAEPHRRANVSKSKDRRNSLQSLLQLPFKLHYEHLSLSDKTLKNSMKPFQKSVDEGCKILSARISYDDLNGELSKHTGEDLDSECQIPQAVIEATIDNMNYLMKKSFEKSAITKDIRHFMYMHTFNHPESKAYWRQCKKDLNFDPPDEIDSIEATESQRSQYQQLISNVRKKRAILHTLHDNMLENYRERLEKPI